MDNLIIEHQDKSWKLKRLKIKILIFKLTQYLRIKLKKKLIYIKNSN